MIERILSVSQLNDYVSGIMTYDPILRNLRLRGEVSNLKISAAGHLYFSLKDESALIRCVMFGAKEDETALQLQEGQEVVASGQVSLYTKEGQYQFYAQEIQRQGQGELYQRFEILKEKLAQKGYFDAEKKRALPLVPKGVGLVTSRTGAVLHDILHVSGRRCPMIPILLAPSAVQGKEASQEICRAIDLLNQQEDIDLIILARGGGSLEDLWPFNTEEVAEAIYRSRLPVISAIGHETDYSISDFVADLRAPTPSAAAEIAFPEKEYMHQQLAQLFSNAAAFLQSRIEEENNKLQSVFHAIKLQEPSRRIEGFYNRAEGLMQRLILLESMAMNERKYRQEQLFMQITLKSPQEILKNGYAIIQRKGKLVLSAKQLNNGDELDIVFADGRKRAIIKEDVS